MDTTRREFVELAGLSAAMGLLSGCGARCIDISAAVTAGARGQNCVTGHTFENWSRTLKFRPRNFCKPRTEQDVIDIVKAARAAGTHVRTQGAGHSFSQILTTPDTLVSLDDLASPISVDGNRVTLPAGIRLKCAIRELRQRGLAFRNIGSVTEQSIAGAFSTGTHGSGLKLGAISTQVMSVRLVTGNGDVHTITEADAQDLSAARINLGALGIITQVTLECREDYQLDYRAYLTTFDKVIDRIDELNATNERVVLWWLVTPLLPRDTVVLLTKNPVNATRGFLAEADRAASPKVSTRRLPWDTADLVRTARDGTGTQDFKLVRHVVENYDDALTIPLLPVYHRECEYAIPVADTKQALVQFRDVVEEGKLSLDLPVEVRFVAADDILLSPCYGRTVSYIGASTLKNSTEVFERFEPLMKVLDGKSHWGKNFTLTQEEVQAAYPTTYETFRTVRNTYDPKRVFTNTLLDELFP